MRKSVEGMLEAQTVWANANSKKIYKAVIENAIRKWYLSN